MTELIWQGKYDKDGKKNGPVRIALSFQTVDTVNESAQDRGRRMPAQRMQVKDSSKNRNIKELLKVHDEIVIYTFAEMT